MMISTSGHARPVAADLPEPSDIPPIPGTLRAYVVDCIEFDLPTDRARIDREFGRGPGCALYVICRVVSERHGIPCGPPWRETERKNVCKS